MWKRMEAQEASAARGSAAAREITGGRRERTGVRRVRRAKRVGKVSYDGTGVGGAVNVVGKEPATHTQKEEAGVCRE